MPYHTKFPEIESKLQKLAERYNENKVKNVVNEVIKISNIQLKTAHFQSLSVYSQANIVTQLKKLIMRVFDGNLRSKEENEINNFFAPYNEAKRNKQTARIKADNDKDLPELINEKDYIKTAIELIKSDSYLDNGLGFMALTGRRSIEIFKIAKFSFTDTYTVPSENEKEQFYKAIIKNSQNVLIFEGQAKKYEHFESYPIVCLIDLRTFFANWKRFRNECELRKFNEKTNSQVQQVIGKALENRAKKYFSEFWKSGKTVAKDTRLAYSFLSVKQVVSNEKPKGIFYDIENGTPKYLKKNEATLLNLAYSLLGHSDTNTLKSYFLKLNNIKNI